MVLVDKLNNTLIWYLGPTWWKEHNCHSYPLTSPLLVHPGSINTFLTSLFIMTKYVSIWTKMLFKGRILCLWYLCSCYFLCAFYSSFKLLLGTLYIPTITCLFVPTTPRSEPRAYILPDESLSPHLTFKSWFCTEFGDACFKSNT